MRQAILYVSSLALIVVGIALLAVGGISVNWVRFAVSYVLILIGLFFLGLTVYESNRPGISRSQANSPLQPPRTFRHCEAIARSVAHIRDSSWGPRFIAGGEITPFVLAGFTTLLLDPRQFHGRIVEEIRPHGRQIRQKVSCSLLLDEVRLTRGVEPSSDSGHPDEEVSAAIGPEVDGPRTEISQVPDSTVVNTSKPHELTVFYPAVVVRKGEIQDNFHVDIKGQEAVVTLTFEEYCQLITVAIRSVQKSMLNRLEQAQHDYLSGLVDRTLALICGRGVQSDDYCKYEEAAEQLTQDIDAFIDKSHLESSLQNHLAAISGLARDYCSRYPVVVVLPPEVVNTTRAVVRYEREYTPRWCYGKARGNWWRFFMERLSAILGARSGDLEVEIGRASEAQSYHILINASEDAYLGDQRIDGIENYQMLGHNDVHYRFRRPLGQSYVHGYFRDVIHKKSVENGVDASGERHSSLPADESVAKSGHAANGLRLRVRFFETPPGSIGKSTISATAAFVLVWAVGAVFTAAGGAPQNVDFPAVILAFPAIAAAFVGFERSASESVVGADVVAKVAALLTFMLTLLAAGLYMRSDTRPSARPS